MKVPAFLVLLSSASALSLPNLLDMFSQQVMDSTFNLCPVDIPLTCTNSTPVENTCCFESPGGIMLQTQFWDYYPPIGANDSFTLHGLWPDNCDGTYEQFCDDSLNLKVGDLKRILVDEFNDPELYGKMEDVWKNFNGDDESLWVHEWNKHATCIKTLRPTCYGGDFKKDENIYDFFRISMQLYEKYPTFDFLAEKGIVPSLDKTYTKKEIAAALEEKFEGNPVFFKCNRYHALQEIWYYHHVKGPVKGEKFVPIPSMLSPNCPETGIKFLPKGDFSPPPNQPPKDPSGKRGYLKLSDHSGCIISNGQWYGHGTCATFRVVDSQFGGYNLLSSKGVCGVTEAGELNCNRQNTVTKYQFQFDKSKGEVGYGGNFDWCFDESKKHGLGRFLQVPVKLADGKCESFKLRLG